MTKNQYRGARKRLEQTIVGFGRVLGLSPRQAQRIDAGHAPVPEPVARLIRLIEVTGTKVEDVK